MKGSTEEGHTCVPSLPVFINMTALLIRFNERARDANVRHKNVLFT